MKGRQMIQRRNKNLHVVREQEDPTDEIVKDIMQELNNKNTPQEELNEQIKQHKKEQWRKRIICVAVVLVAMVGIYLLVNLQTYNQARTIDSYQNSGTSNNSYIQFSEGVLKYSRDGISYLDQNGEEQWNQSYQMKNPFVDVGEKAAAVADKGGNDILVFQKNGIKGEIHTTIPIEKISVSEQGIVSAILKNESSAKIMCYDTAGNVLVEHKTSLAGTGYPLDVALSANGEVMQVLYLYTQDG